MKIGRTLIIGGVFIALITPTPQVAKLKRIVETSLDDDKASDITTIPLTGKSSLADYMVVASGTSQRHLLTLADHIEAKLHALGVKSISVQGRKSDGWVVVDAGNMIIHLFKPENRLHYNIEKMWGFDQPREGRAKREKY